MENPLKEIDKLNDKKEIIDQIYKVKTDIHTLDSKLDKLIKYYLGDTESDMVYTFRGELENGVIGSDHELETIYKMSRRYEYMYEENGWEEEFKKISLDDI